VQSLRMKAGQAACAQRAAPPGRRAAARSSRDSCALS
jgi:hypothetical protein